VLVHLVDANAEFSPKPSWAAADALWLRSHSVPTQQTLQVSRCCAAWAEQNGVALHVSFTLAEHFPEQPVHVRDLPAQRRAARQLSRQRWLSTHRIEDLEAAPLGAEEGWVISPFAPPLSKMAAGSPLDRERLFALPESVRARTLLLGGVTPELYQLACDNGFFGAVTSGAGYCLTAAAF
jgi:hypothetical protein